MPLKHNWKDLLLKAWSLRLLYLSLGVQALDALMPYLLDYTSPPWLKGAALLVTAGAGYARLMPQATLPTEDPSWHSERKSLADQSLPS